MTTPRNWTSTSYGSRRIFMTFSINFCRPISTKRSTSWVDMSTSISTIRRQTSNLKRPRTSSASFSIGRSSNSRILVLQDKASKFVQSIPADEHGNVGPIDEATALAAVAAFVTGLDDDWVSSLKAVAIDAIIGAGVGTLMLGPPGLILGPVLAIFADQLLVEKNLGLPGLVSGAKAEVKIYQQTTSVAALPPPAEGTPGPSGAPEVFSLSELATASADFQRLLLHLEANRVYYANKIWAGELPEVRLARFRIKGIDRFVHNEPSGFHRQ